jgi:hypothetical protein
MTLRSFSDAMLAGRTVARFFVLVCLSVAMFGCTRTDRPRDASLPDSPFDFDLGGHDLGMPDVLRFPDASVDTCTPEGMGATLGRTCTVDDECNDGCFCNGVEACREGVCVAGNDPCVDTIDCTVGACLEETDACFQEPVHAMCSNGDACDGMEVCDPLFGGCRSSEPLYCNDENACTVDSCDRAMGCVHVLRDLDGDGFVDARCGGDDCDDDPRFGRAIYPGAPEVCTNRRDDNCDGLRDYNDPRCVPTNDTCATAERLPGPGTYSGSTRGLRNDHTLSCGSGTADAVFAFSLAAPADVRVTPSGSGIGAVAIRPLASCATGPDVRCSGGAAPVAFVRSLPAGEYAIIVKTTTPGIFDLVLRITEPTMVPPTDRCDAMTQDISAGGTFMGSWEETGNDYAPSCGTVLRDAPDAAYRFVLTSPKDVRIRANAAGSYNTVLSVTTDCANPSAALSCTAAASPEFRRRAMPAGTYYVLVEPVVASSTGWSLTATITDPVPPPVGDTCVGPVAISPTMAGSVSVSTLELDGIPSCQSSGTTYRDAYFTFELSETRDVELTLGSGSGFPSAFFALQTSCGVPGTELRCRSFSSTTTQRFRSLAPGRYFVHVTTTASSGDVTASMTTSAPTPIPPNDGCAGAIVIDPEAMVTRRRDTLAGFEDDVAGGSCGGFSAPDAFYTFTLTSPRLVTITATSSVMTTTAFLVLRNAACNGTVVQCATGTPTASVVRTLDPGTYFVQVEQPSASAGEFLLQFLFSPPP